MADDVRRFFEVNTLSTFVCCQHAGLIMTEQDEGGAIVNIGDWAVERPYRDYSAYFISKGAIPTLTRMFAVELAPKVRVNAVLPGPRTASGKRLRSRTPPRDRRHAARPCRTAGKRGPRRRGAIGKRLYHRRLSAGGWRPHVGSTG